jgi:hypothetical protein
MDVTLCAIDHVAYDLTRMALERCLKQIDFADVVICSDKDILPGARHVRTQASEPVDAMHILWYELPKHIKTSHYLYIQWDSWIINPAAWTDEFLAYDYIGAPWPEREMARLPRGCDRSYNVGNGGFSLRSTRLAQAIADNDLSFDLLEDRAICVHHRRQLEGLGMKWPDRALAERFSAEMDWPQSVPFGFHAAFNFICTLTPDEYLEMMGSAPAYVQDGHGLRALRNNVAALRNGATWPDWRGPLKPEWMDWPPMLGAA